MSESGGISVSGLTVGGVACTPKYRYVYASYIDRTVVRKRAGTGGTWNW